MVFNIRVLTKNKYIGYYLSGLRVSVRVTLGRKQSLLPCSIEKIPDDSVGCSARTGPSAQWVLDNGHLCL